MIGSFGAVRAGWRSIRRAKRLVALVALVDMLTCLPAALFVGVAVHTSGAHRVDATELARGLDPDFQHDLFGTDGGLHDLLSVLVIATLVLFFVVRPLFMGGYVGIASRKERIRFDDFVQEGGAVYWKFLRVSLFGLLAAYLLSLSAAPLLEYIDDQAAEFAVEGPALRYRLITEGVVFAAFWVFGTVLDYARVGIRMHRRPGVLAELVRSFVFVLQHPFDTLGFSLISFLLEVGVIAAFVWLLAAADGAYVVTSVIVLLLIQVLIGLREAARLFHIAGAWHLRFREEGDEFGPDGEALGAPEDPLLSNLPWHG